MNKIRFVKAHFIYWSLYIVIDFFAWKFSSFDIKADLQHQLVYWLGTVLDYFSRIVEFYLYYIIIIPKYLLDKFTPYKYILFSLLIMPLSVLVRASCWNVEVLFSGEIPYQEIKQQVSELIWHATHYANRAILFSVVELWFLSEIEKSKLNGLIVDSKLNFLKSQINPHFIFNTLNNIYSLSLKSRGKTGEALNKLKSTFNYLKKVETSNTVSVIDTKEYISSYVELSKMRLQHPEKVSYSFKNTNVDNRIYPMLLMPFIENAFKHSNLVGDHDFISIDIECLESELEIEVKNSMPVTTISKDVHSGIGIKNVKERLNLLFRKGNYSLSTKVLDKEFVTTLKMPYAKL